MAKTSTLPFIKDSPYLAQIRQRSGNSRVYRRHQAVGLALAVLLRDRQHKSFYIKLAKQYPTDFLLRIAKDVSERKQVIKPAAYFMKVFREEAEKQFIKENKEDSRKNKAGQEKKQLKLKIRKKKKKELRIVKNGKNT